MTASHAVVHGQNAKPENLFRKWMQKLIKDDELRELFNDPLSSSTDLSNEIALWRHRQQHFQKLKAEGVTEYAYQLQNGQRVYDIDDLLDKATSQLRSLILAQHHMHPESGTKGNINVTVSIRGKASSDAGETPELEAGEASIDEQVSPHAPPEPAEAPSLEDELLGK